MLKYACLIAYTHAQGKDQMQLIPTTNSMHFKNLGRCQYAPHTQAHMKCVQIITPVIYIYANKSTTRQLSIGLNQGVTLRLYYKECMTFTRLQDLQLK